MTQNELRRFLAKYKPKTQYTQKTDAIKNNKPVWHRRDFNTQRTGYVQPGITIEQARDYDQLLKFVDSRTKDLQ